MSIKKPTMKGMKNAGYLGHFAQDKYLAAGHNTNENFQIHDQTPWSFSDSGDAMQDAIIQDKLDQYKKNYKKKKYEKDSPKTKEEKKIKAAQEAVFKKK